MSDFYDEQMQAADKQSRLEASRPITKAEAAKAYNDGLHAQSQMARLKGYKRMTKPMRDDFVKWTAMAEDSRTILARYFSQD